MGIYSSSRYHIERIEKPKKEELEDKDHHKDMIEDYEQDTGIELIDRHDTLEELEDEHDEWHSMTKYQRRRSDEKSLQMFGKTNKERYEDNKSDLLKLKENFEYFFEMNDEANNNASSSTIKLKHHKDPDAVETEKDNDTESAKKFTNDTGIMVFYQTNTLDELERLHNDWQSMTYDQKLKSDDMSVELFGIKSMEFYDKIKSKLLRNKKNLNNVNKDMTNKAATSSDTILTNEALNIFNEYIENSKKDLTISEEIIINQDRKKSLNRISSMSNSIFGILSDLPYFDSEEMRLMGVYGRGSTDNFYGILSDNKRISESISSIEWFDMYSLVCNGIIPSNHEELSRMRNKKLNELYSDYYNILENGTDDEIRSRKQSILELGWNPEIEFNARNRKLSTDRIKSRIKENHVCAYDISNIEYREINENKKSENEELFPVYIILTYTNTAFGKAIKGFTHSIYSHAALSLDSTLDKIYSYSMFDAFHGGFSLESLKNYIKSSKDSIMCIYTIFVNKKNLLKIKLNLDKNLTNKTKYSMKGIIGIVLNKPIIQDNAMICSQFVDDTFKHIGIDLTNKNSAIVTPNDIYLSKNKALYKVYEGKMSEYNKNKVDKQVKGILRSKRSIKESYIKDNDILDLYNEYILPMEVVKEVKDIPIQFDKEGNLLVSNIKDIDFENEYSKSHRLLKSYESHNNIEGMKYELSKLWYMNILLEKQIYSTRKNDNKLYDTRARVLNDFNKYLKIVMKKDKDFNFSEYYDESPFSDSKYKINNHTLKYLSNIPKEIAKFLL